jgi:hypothetical protein
MNNLIKEMNLKLRLFSVSKMIHCKDMSLSPGDMQHFYSADFVHEEEDGAYLVMFMNTSQYTGFLLHDLN